jgi:hypothetical protein
MLDGAIAYVRANPAATLGLAAFLAVVGAVVQTGLLVLAFGSVQRAASAAGGGGFGGLGGAGAFGGAGTDLGGPAMTDAQAFGLLAGVLGAAAITLAVQFVLQTVGTGMLTHVMGRAVLGEHLDLGGAWTKVRPQVLRLLAVTVLVSLVVVTALVLPLVPGIVLLAVESSPGVGVVLLLVGLALAVLLGAWLYVRLALAAPALVLEDIGPVKAMRRSAALVRGSWWRVLGILLLTTVVAQIVAGVLAVPFSLASSVVVASAADDSAVAAAFGLFLTSLGSVVATAVVLPFSAGVTALLYLDRRMRREGLDLVLARRLTGGPAGAPPAAPPTDAPPQRW